MSIKRVGKKAVVLIKNPESAAVVKSALESSGFEVSVAKGAEEARRIAADSGADLVLFDEGPDETCDKTRTETTVLEEFFRVNLDLLCIADTSGRFLQMNPEWERILGFSIPELLETNFLDLVHPEDKGKTIEAIDALKAQREVLGFANRYRTKSGDYRWIEWRSYPSGDVIYAAARDITERKRIEEELEAAVTEKQSLLKELQHRVKNTLSMIASLASLEEMRTEDPSTKEIIAGFKGRIYSLALLYDMLYRTGDTKEVELGAYFKGIVHSVRDSLLNREGRIELLTDCDSVAMGVKNATQLGLIVNEVLTNALKYAFPGDRRGKVSLTLRSSEDRIVISIEDDGIGFPAGFDPDQSSGIGFQLLRMLAEQMGGTSEIGNGVKGTRIVLDMPSRR